METSSHNQDIPIGFAPDIAMLMRDLTDMRGPRVGKGTVEW